LFEALAAGACAVTPNRRLARQLQRSFDREQARTGRRAWPTPSILPYASWLEVLWRRRCEQDGDSQPRTLLTSIQSGQLWRRVVDAGSTPLFDAQGGSVLAAQAWSIVLAWGESREPWRAWSSDHPGDDPSMFARWAQAYSRMLARERRIDATQLADALAEELDGIALRDTHVLLVGFLHTTPQQNRLIDALSRQGVRIEGIAAPSHPDPVARRTLASAPRDELLAALSWARERALARPETSIGIVVEDLAQRREEVVALADEVLCPGLCLPASLGAGRPYEISLGIDLAQVPLVTCALGLVALSLAPLAIAEAAALLRSRYLPDAEASASSRGSIEREWLERGLNEITLEDAIGTLIAHGDTLGQRWRSARSGAVSRPRARATPREWGDAWRAWLAEAGWPGSTPLDSAEYQAREAWDDMLSDFVRVGTVAPLFRRDEALDLLRGLARERVFQPEGSDASIQIMGTLEGSGLVFDALWVAGLSADRWPKAPDPNPLIPIAWQRARDLPQSSASNALEYARSLTHGFASAAGEVIFSSSSTVDDYARAPSALLLDYPEVRSARRTPLWSAAIAADALLERVDDDHAPALEPGTAVRGGAWIVEAQSECPFRAAATYRLGVRPWPQAPAGLSHPERGRILHATMAALWRRLQDHAGLIALSQEALATCIEQAVAEGCSALAASRWTLLPRAVRDSEAGRLIAVVTKWLDIERARPPFTVAAIEGDRAVELAGLGFRLRVDRVDTLAEGGAAIIDYKSGTQETTRSWFRDRPCGSQLGMYALAQREAQPEEPIRAVLYAKLRADEIAPIGVALDPLAWPGLDLVERARFPTWSAMEAWWRTSLDGLAADIARGWAAVDPRTPLPCRYCGLQALCRIDSVRHPEDEEDDDE